MKRRATLMVGLGAGLSVALAACAAPESAAPETAATQEPLVIPSSETKYRVLPPVVYPPDSRRRGEQGTALLRVVVGARGGTPRNVGLLQSSGHPALDQSALQAMRSAQFQPYMRDGKLWPFQSDIPIRFVLR